MELLNVPRLLISGSSSRAGKFLFGIGLGYELLRRNVNISSCVIGPNLAQASVHRRVTSRYVRCLDTALLTPTQIATSAFMAGVGADVLLIHGRGELFDSPYTGSAKGSDSEIAGLLKTPTIIMIDASNFGSSVAALLKGYESLARGYSIMGGVVNRIKPEQKAADGENKNKDYYDSGLELYGLSKLIGAIPELKLSSDTPKRIPSERDNYSALPLQFLHEVSQAVGNSVDIETIVEKAQGIVSIRIPELEHRPWPRRTRIAVTEDPCFQLMFQDNLDLLRYFGAEIVPFSPLADNNVPDDIGGLYITGVYLREYGAELSANENMLKSIHSFYRSGGAIYSEGGGSAYLSKEFQLGEKGEYVRGAGILPGKVACQPGALSYIEVATIEDSILGIAGKMVRGIDLAEWRVTWQDKSPCAFRISKRGSAAIHEGYSPGAHVLATFNFLHFGSNPEMAKVFVDSAEVTKSINKD